MTSHSLKSRVQSASNATKHPKVRRRREE
jgi:uncharacterized membrane protein YeaQ/YmgE (transglycosylase-associated protein family)